MVEQAGEAVFDGDGIMQKGVIVRHLLLPGCLSDSKNVVRYLFETYGKDVYKRQPLNLARSLQNAGARILGTSPAAIDLAEDRDQFREMMEKLNIPMPKSGMAVNTDEALDIAKEIGYPLMVRPSYVLGGRGMEVVHSDEELSFYMEGAIGVTPDRPILIDRFLMHATEVEADAVCDEKDCFVPSIMQHIELAGIHSGDSACVLPPVSLSQQEQATIEEYTKKIALSLDVCGPVSYTHLHWEFR